MAEKNALKNVEFCENTKNTKIWTLFCLITNKPQIVINFNLAYLIAFIEIYLYK